MYVLEVDSRNTPPQGGLFPLWGLSFQIQSKDYGMIRFKSYKGNLPSGQTAE